MTTRAALYARVSTKDKGQDTENQLLQLREFAQRSGWTVVHEYIDYASGKKATRDQFQQMFTDASRRQFDVVVAWSLDRLTREGIYEAFGHAKRLKDSGVDFVSFTEEMFRTAGPAGELMFAIAAWIAKQERARLVERTKAGMEKAKLRGTKSGKTIGRQRAIFNRGEAMRLRAEGQSLSQIADALGVSVMTVQRAVKAAG